jgi:hypothetical protein
VIFRSAKWAHRVLVLCIARPHIYLANFRLQLFHVGCNFRPEQQFAFLHLTDERLKVKRINDPIFLHDMNKELFGSLIYGKSLVE